MCVEKCSALGERFKDLFMCIMLIFIRLIFRSWSALQMWRIRIRGQLAEGVHPMAAVVNEFIEEEGCKNA
jgi:hypothetical protein